MYIVTIHRVATYTCRGSRRKSRLVKLIELIHRAVDDHLKERLHKIFAAKERYAFELKQEFEYVITSQLYVLHMLY